MAPSREQVWEDTKRISHDAASGVGRRLLETNYGPFYTSGKPVFYDNGYTGRGLLRQNQSHLLVSVPHIVFKDDPTLNPSARSEFERFRAVKTYKWYDLPNKYFQNYGFLAIEFKDDDLKRLGGESIAIRVGRKTKDVLKDDYVYMVWQANKRHFAVKKQGSNGEMESVADVQWQMGQVDVANHLINVLKADGGNRLEVSSADIVTAVDMLSKQAPQLQKRWKYVGGVTDFKMALGMHPLTVAKMVLASLNMSDQNKQAITTELLEGQLTEPLDLYHRLDQLGGSFNGAAAAFSFAEFLSLQPGRVKDIFTRYNGMPASIIVGDELMYLTGGIIKRAAAKQAALEGTAREMAETPIHMTKLIGAEAALRNNYLIAARFMLWLGKVPALLQGGQSGATMMQRALNDLSGYLEDGPLNTSNELPSPPSAGHIPASANSGSEGPSHVVVPEEKE